MFLGLNYGKLTLSWLFCNTLKFLAMLLENSTLFLNTSLSSIACLFQISIFFLHVDGFFIFVGQDFLKKINNLEYQLPIKCNSFD